MNLPSSFIDIIKPLLNDDYEKFVESLDYPLPTSVRLNPNKTKSTPQHKQVGWCSNGYYLPERILFTFDPKFHAGEYYVQEASSMFVEQLLKSFVKSPVRLLDLCAAPGGKTTLALSTIPEGSFVVANEYVPQRAQILAENIIKWGTSNTIVTNNTPADYGKLRDTFDVIIVDAPCSGEGMFRKDEEALSGWSVDNVNLCVERQKEILSNVWNALKPGGILIYSTCTYNTEENEEIAQFLIEEFNCEALPEVEIAQEWGITREFKGSVPFYRFMPHKTLGEGFSVTAIRKGEGNYSPLKPGKSKLKTIPLPNNLKPYLKEYSKYEYTIFKDRVIALDATAKEMMQLMEKFNILHAGISVAVTDKGKDFIPHHALSQSVELNIEETPKIEVDYKGAISYLRREAMPLDTQQRGIALITYNSTPLGWVKCVGNRANNLYPQEWRIRSEHAPSDAPSIF